MQPAPLAGTATKFEALADRDAVAEDATRTPRGDSNKSYGSILMHTKPDAARAPCGDGNCLSHASVALVLD